MVTVSVKFLTYENDHVCDQHSDCDFSFHICLKGDNRPR